MRSCPLGPRDDRVSAVLGIGRAHAVGVCEPHRALHHATACRRTLCLASYIRGKSVVVINDSRGDSLIEAFDEIRDRHPVIRSLEYTLGVDHYGDEAAWVTLLVPDEAEPVGPDGQITEAAQAPDGLLTAIWSIDRFLKQLDYVPNVSFRTESEQEEIIKAKQEALIDGDQAE